MKTDLLINRHRLCTSLAQMAEIGATEHGGCNRQALTDEDRSGRDLYLEWAREAGCEVRVDQMGNLFALRPGSHPGEPVVLTGSHLDTQPSGGQYDGVYGVLAGLEVLRTLNDANVQTRAPLVVAVWTNEEGVRFAPAMIGSGVWSGVFDLDYGLSREGPDGTTLGEELRRIGYAGDSPCAPFPIGAAFELHIEQGPILVDENLSIGVVTGVQGMRWYDVTLSGASCHAGPTPMDSRQDPVMGLQQILHDSYALAYEHAPEGRTTIGTITVDPETRNTVPETVRFSVDLRHPSDAVLDRMELSLRESVREAASRYGLTGHTEEIWKSAAVQFDERVAASVRGASRKLGYSHREMISGAGHDSVYVAKVAPTAMIFIPCKDGLSHNPAEYATPEDLEAGCNVLLHAILDQAGADS